LNGALNIVLIVCGMHTAIHRDAESRKPGGDGKQTMFLFLIARTGHGGDQAKDGRIPVDGGTHGKNRIHGEMGPGHAGVPAGALAASFCIYELPAGGGGEGTCRDALDRQVGASSAGAVSRHARAEDHRRGGLHLAGQQVDFGAETQAARSAGACRRLQRLSRVPAFEMTRTIR